MKNSSNPNSQLFLAAVILCSLFFVGMFASAGELSLRSESATVESQDQAQANQTTMNNLPDGKIEQAYYGGSCNQICPDGTPIFCLGLTCERYPLSVRCTNGYVVTGAATCPFYGGAPIYGLPVIPYYPYYYGRPFIPFYPYYYHRHF